MKYVIEPEIGLTMKASKEKEEDEEDEEGEEEVKYRPVTRRYAGSCAKSGSLSAKPSRVDKVATEPKSKKRQRSSSPILLSLLVNASQEPNQTECPSNLALALWSAEESREDVEQEMKHNGNGLQV
jgi:hypothetical protein